MEEEEPVTPMGRLCLLPEHNHVIHCAIGFKNPIDIDALKHEISNSIMIKIPRFSCILTVDPHDGSEHWKKVKVTLDDHIVNCRGSSDSANSESDPPLQSNDDDDDDVVNSYLADMAISSPMKMDKPLWELHILHAQKFIIMRVHHAIADGMSLMSLLWTMGKSSNDEQNQINNNNNNNNNNIIIINYANIKGGNNKSMKNMGLWKKIVCIWYTIVFGLMFIVRCLWVKDKARVISGFVGMEFWPRKVATARFKISDMKTIKNVIPNATVNDVLCGILWCGLTKYLNIQYPRDLQDGVQITGMCPYNLRQQPGVQDVASMLTKNTRTPWGNRFSVILLPFVYMKKSLEPLAYVTLAKEMMDRKKQSMEARLSYNVVSLGSTLLGPKVAGLFYYNLFCNTSFLISNIAGPSELILIGGNPVTSIRVTSSSQPHALTMHMVGYEGWGNLQIQVAKDVIHDPNMLAKCFENALLDMKAAAHHYCDHVPATTRAKPN